MTKHCRQRFSRGTFHNVSQRGFLTLISVALIVLGCCVATAAVHLFVTNSRISLADAQGTKAFYLAEAGIQASGYHLENDALSSRIGCTQIKNHRALTHIALGEGTFSVEQIGSPSYASTATLSTNLSNSARIIPLSSTAGFAPRGSAMIGSEIIRYGRLNRTQLLDVQRGAAGSTVSQHASGEHVSQYQCNISSQGGIPNTITPKAKRTLDAGFILQEGWIAGDHKSGKLQFARWNRSAANTWNDAAQQISSPKKLRAISMLNHGEGWAGGDTRNNNFGIYTYDPTTQTWLQDTTTGNKPFSFYTKAIQGLKAVSHKDAWAVGDRGGLFSNRRVTILRWNGHQWCYLSSSSTSCTNTTAQEPTDRRNRYRKTLYAVDAVDSSGDGLTDTAYAVGEKGLVMRYTAQTDHWEQTDRLSETLFGVSVMSNRDAWAAGEDTSIFHWDGRQWTQITSLPHKSNSIDLYAIHMFDYDNNGIADDGWAVGSRGRAYHFTRGHWDEYNIQGADQLRAVDAFGPRDAWIAGKNGHIYHWDGTSITQVSSPMSTQIRAMSLIGPKLKAYSEAGWHESFA